VLLVTQMWYPASKASEVGKTYFEAIKKFPDDKTISKPIVRTAIRATKDGFHNITVSIIKPGKVKEILDIAHGRLLMFGAIEGFKYSVEVWMTQIEAFSAIGRQPPE